MDQKKWKDFVSQNSIYFWWMPEAAKKNLSQESVVEAILNYGEESNLSQLFEILGAKKIKQIFYKQINQKRVNYRPQVINYFNLYFAKHV